MKKIILFTAVVFLISCEPENVSVHDISWIEGTWAREFNGNTQVENWKLENNELLGSSFFVNAADTTPMQNLKIIQEGNQVVYNLEDIGFDMKSTYILQHYKGDSIVFSNKINQWPQIIIYKNVSPKEIEIVITGNQMNDPKRTTFTYSKN